MNILATCASYFLLVYLNADPELDTDNAIRIQNTIVDFDDLFGTVRRNEYGTYGRRYGQYLAP